jgi:hypothetical protein
MAIAWERIHARVKVHAKQPLAVVKALIHARDKVFWK